MQTFIFHEQLKTRQTPLKCSTFALKCRLQWITPASDKTIFYQRTKKRTEYHIYSGIHNEIHIRLHQELRMIQDPSVVNRIILNSLLFVLISYPTSSRLHKYKNDETPFGMFAFLYPCMTQRQANINFNAIHCKLTPFYFIGHCRASTASACINKPSWNRNRIPPRWLVNSKSTFPSSLTFFHFSNSKSVPVGKFNWISSLNKSSDDNRGVVVRLCICEMKLLTPPGGKYDQKDDRVVLVLWRQCYRSRVRTLLQPFELLWPE